MSTRPNLDRSIADWLAAEASDRAPERLLEASRARIRITRQRRAWLPAWRIPDMSNTVRLVVAAAAVVVVAVVGYQLLISPNTGGPAPVASPTPTSTPTPAAFSDQPGGGEALAPGSYVITHVSPFRITITVPSGWYKGRYDWALFADADNSSINFGAVDNLYADPCHIDLGFRDPAVGPTVADLVTALGTVPGLEASPPSDVTVAGHAGKLIELTGPLSWDGCFDEPRVWQMNGGDFMPAPESTYGFRAWILDVDGTRLVIATLIRPDATADTLAELEGMVDSLEIDFQ